VTSTPHIAVVIPVFSETPFLPKLFERLETVFAVRRSRKESGLRRIGFDLFHRMFRLLIDFPIEPNTGTLIAGLGFAVGGFFLVGRILGIEIAQTGFTTLVTLVLFLGGVQLIAIGIVSEHLGWIYDEVKRRPHFIVKGRIGFD